MKSMILRIALSTALICVLTGVTRGGTVLDRIVAKVNNDIILLSEFQQAFNPIAAELRRQTPADKLDEQLKQLRFQILESLIDELLLYQKGVDMGMDVSNEEVDEAITELREENNLQEDEAFHFAMAQEGLDLEALRTQLRRQIVASRVRAREIRGKIEVTEADVKAYYREHEEEYRQPERLRLQLLLLEKPEDASELRLARITAKRDEIIERLRDGDDFTELVAEYSDGPAPSAGGDIGFVTQEELAPEFAEIAFALDLNEVSEPFETAYGINFVKVTDRKEASKAPLKEVRAKIEKTLLEDSFRRSSLRFADELRENAYIEKLL